MTIGNIRDGSFTDVRDAATARIEGNNAKSNESLTLIARGSGGSFEEAWQTSAAIVEDRISRFGRDFEVVWQPYVDVHTQIRTLDDGGQWDKAVALATDQAGPNTTFTAFDTNVARVVDSASAETTGGLAATVPWMIIGAILSLHRRHRDGGARSPRSAPSA